MANAKKTQATARNPPGSISNTYYFTLLVHSVGFTHTKTLSSRVLYRGILKNY